MDRNTSPGLTPIWLISLALVLGVFVILAVPLLLFDNGKADWIGFSGNIVGAAMTILAALVGYGAIRKQLRISLVSREEDRLEKDLPGLRQANDLLKHCAERFLPDPAHILRMMEARNLIFEGTFTIADMRREVPDVDLRMARNLFSILSRFYYRCIRYDQDRVGTERLTNEMVNDIVTFPPDIIEHRKRTRAFKQSELEQHHQALLGLLDELRKTSCDFDTRITNTESRLNSFRHEIESYFGPQ